MIKIATILISAILMPVVLLAQTPARLRHGTTFGQKVDSLQQMPASHLEVFMGKMPRISTTITGKVLKVDHTQGGWFELDAGNGKTISVHFKNYGINIPADLKGHKVMLQGVAQRIMPADDMQHYAGDTVGVKKQHQTKVDPKRKLSFEATGVMVL